MLLSISLLYALLDRILISCTSFLQVPEQNTYCERGENLENKMFTMTKKDWCICVICSAIFTIEQRWKESAAEMRGLKKSGSHFQTVDKTASLAAACAKYYSDSDDYHTPT